MGVKKISVTHQRPECIGCGLCAELAPQNWVMNPEDGRSDLVGSHLKGQMQVGLIDEDQLEENKMAAQACPVQIIKVAA